jgi:hypothetical protein
VCLQHLKQVKKKKKKIPLSTQPDLCSEGRGGERKKKKERGREKLHPVGKSTAHKRGRQVN